jgi:hypothetical protein
MIGGATCPLPHGRDSVCPLARARGSDNALLMGRSSLKQHLQKLLPVHLVMLVDASQNARERTDLERIVDRDSYMMLAAAQRR